MDMRDFTRRKKLDYPMRFCDEFKRIKSPNDVEHISGIIKKIMEKLIVVQEEEI